MNAKRIAALLHQMGGNQAYIGFRYAVNCVDLILEDEELQYYITEPYLNTAAKYHTTVKCVERDVRTLVKHIWEEGDRKVLEEVACAKLIKRPKNKVFFALIAEYMRSKMT